MFLEDPMIFYQGRYSTDVYSSLGTRTLYNSQIYSGKITSYDVSGEYVDLVRYDFFQALTLTSERGEISIPFTFSRGETPAFFRLYIDTYTEEGEFLSYIYDEVREFPGSFLVADFIANVTALRFQILNKNNVKVSNGGLTSTLEISDPAKGRFSLGRHCKNSS